MDDLKSLKNKSINEMSDEELIICMREISLHKLDFLIGKRLLTEFNCDVRDYVKPCETITYEYPKGTPKTWKWKEISEKCNEMETNAMDYIKEILPHVVKLKQILLNDNLLSQKQIFYVDGDKFVKKIFVTIIEDFDQLIIANTKDYAGDLGAIFKKYIADIPIPIITDGRYNVYMCLVKHYQKLKVQFKRDQILRSVQLFLLLLPNESRELLKHIIEVLHTAVQLQGLDKAIHLARIFVVHLICPRTLPPEGLAYMIMKMYEPIEFMIVTGMEIFDVPSDLLEDVRSHFDNHEIKCPSDWKEKRCYISFTETENSTGFMRILKKFAGYFK